MNILLLPIPPPKESRGFIFSFSIRVGKWEFETKDDYYRRTFGVVLFKWKANCGKPVWQWNFRKPKWPDTERENEWPEVVE